MSSLTARTIRRIGEVISSAGRFEGADGLSSMETGAVHGMTDHVVFLVKNYRSDLRLLRWWDENAGSGRPPSCTSAPVSVVEHVRSRHMNSGGGPESARDARLRDWMALWWDKVYERWRTELRPHLLRSTASGDAETAGLLRNLTGTMGILCCVNEGPFGRIPVNGLCHLLFLEMMGTGGIPPEWHDGQPVIVSRNQRGGPELFNGDLGIVLEREGVLFGCFPSHGGVLTLPLDRITSFEPAYAISVHKAQGSEFNEVLFMVPEGPSMRITRQLVYTAVTRAKRRITIIDPGDRLADMRELPLDKRYGILREIVG